MKRINLGGAGGPPVKDMAGNALSELLTLYLDSTWSGNDCPLLDISDLEIVSQIVPTGTFLRV